jgi:hypothetical protein
MLTATMSSGLNSQNSLPSNADFNTIGGPTQTVAGGGIGSHRRPLNIIN